MADGRPASAATSGGGSRPASAASGGSRRPKSKKQRIRMGSVAMNSVDGLRNFDEFYLDEASDDAYREIRDSGAYDTAYIRTLGGEVAAIEWPRKSAAVNRRDRRHLGPTTLLLRRRLCALRAALRTVRKKLAVEDKECAARNIVMLSLEDAFAVSIGAGNERMIDTSLVHGTAQRLRVSQVAPLVEPLLRESTKRCTMLFALKAVVETKLEEVAGDAIVRIARGALGRIIAAERRYELLVEDVAIEFQRLWRGHFARTRIVPWRKSILADKSVRIIQKVFRGYLVRKRVSEIWRKIREERRGVAATRIQSVVRMFLVRLHREEMFARLSQLRDERVKRRAELVEMARRRRAQRREDAALTLQKVWRGLLGRREAYMRRQASYLSHPKARALADAFLAGGDLWGLLGAMNRELERADADRGREMSQASAFADQLRRLRDEQEQDDAQKFQALKAARDQERAERRRRQMGPGSRVTRSLRKAQKFGLDRDEALHGSNNPKPTHTDVKLALVQHLYRDGKPLASPINMRTSGGLLPPATTMVQPSAQNIAPPSSQQRHRTPMERRSGLQTPQYHPTMARPLSEPLRNPVGSHPVDELLPSSLHATKDLKRHMTRRFAEIMHEEHFPDRPTSTSPPASHHAPSSSPSPPPSRSRGQSPVEDWRRATSPGPVEPDAPVNPRSLAGPFSSSAFEKSLHPHQAEPTPSWQAPHLNTDETKAPANTNVPNETPIVTLASDGLYTPGNFQDEDHFSGGGSSSKKDDQFSGGATSQKDDQFSGGGSSSKIDMRPGAASSSLPYANGALTGAEAVVVHEGALVAHGLGAVPVRALLLDVRGLKGPMERLVLHAALRATPIPRSVLDWVAEEVRRGTEVTLSRSTVELARRAGAAGGLMPSTLGEWEAMTGASLSLADGDSSGGEEDDGGMVMIRGQLVRAGPDVVNEKRRRKQRQKYARDPLVAPDGFASTGAGEEAARLFAEMPPSLIKMRWEENIRQVASPAVDILRHHGCSACGDVASVDLERAGIDPVLAGHLQRLIRILAASERLTAPSAVRALYKSRPRAVVPPVIDPAIKAKVRRQRAAKLAASASAFHGDSTGDDASEVAQSLLTSKSRFPPTQTSSSSPTSSSSNTRPLAWGRNRAAEILGTSKGAQLAAQADEDADPLKYRAKRRGKGQANVLPHSSKLPKTIQTMADITNQPQELDPPVVVWEEPGLFLARGGGLDDGATALAERRRMLESESVDAGPRLGGRVDRHAAEHAVKFAAAWEWIESPPIPVETDVRARTMDRGRPRAVDVTIIPPSSTISRASAAAFASLTHRLSDNLDAMVLPPGFDVLPPDESLTAPMLARRAMQRGGMAHGCSAAEALFRVGTALDSLGANISALKEAEARPEDPVDAAVVDAALRIPLPSPVLAEMADHRAGRRRTARARLRSLAPLGLFLRQVLSTDFPPVDAEKVREREEKREHERKVASLVVALAAKEKKYGGKKASSSHADSTAADALDKLDDSYQKKSLQRINRRKQTMLVRERLREARAAARPWVLALKRAGFDTVSSLAYVPAATIAHALTEAYPIRPAPGLPVEEARAVQVAATIPPAKAARLIASVVAAWLEVDPTAAKEIQTSLTTFDPRYQRTATDPGGLRSHDTPAIHSLTQHPTPSFTAPPKKPSTSSIGASPLKSSSPKGQWVRMPVDEAKRRGLLVDSEEEEEEEEEDEDKEQKTHDSSVWRGTEEEAVREAVRRDRERESRLKPQKPLNLAAPIGFDQGEGARRHLAQARARKRQERTNQRMHDQAPQSAETHQDLDDVQRAAAAVRQGARIKAGAGGVALPASLRQGAPSIPTAISRDSLRGGTSN